MYIHMYVYIYIYIYIAMVTDLTAGEETRLDFLNQVSTSVNYWKLVSEYNSLAQMKL